MSHSLSQERFEDPRGWTADELLDVLADDEATDISLVSDEAIHGAIPVAQSNGYAMMLAALEHENGRRSVLRGLAVPAEPMPLPAVMTPPPNDEAAERLLSSVANATGTVFYADTFMLPAEITLQTAVEIEDFLKERGKAKLDPANGSIGFVIECTDLWDACEAAHEVAAELQSRGVEADVDRGHLIGLDGEQA